MSNFEDTHLLYRGPGGRERQLIDEAGRLCNNLTNFYAQNCNQRGIKAIRIFNIAWARYQHRYNRYYQQESSM